MNKLPIRCIDPILKSCEDCLFGSIIYPDYVETYADIAGCIYETCCILGFDVGRPEDEPTEEEWEKFEKWCKQNEQK